MKSLSIFIAFSIATTQTNAQLKISSTGRVDISNQTVINYSTTSTDGLDIKCNATNVAAGTDLIWGYFAYTQANNPGLLTLQSANGAFFTVKANGRVGIYNSNPGVALEIGTTGTSYQLKINGTITLGSDLRSKENIQNLSNSYNKLKQLRGVSYKYKKSELIAFQNFKSGYDSSEKPMFFPKIDTSVSNRTHFGFLAQEVQKIYPELVYKDSLGYLSIDYIGFIPLIINALKEQDSIIALQNQQIEELKKLIKKKNSLKNSVGPESDINISIINSSENNNPFLEQNSPNPFDQNTEIRYYLPYNTKNAYIYLYDMSGMQIKSVPLTTLGKGSITIYGSELKPGMYYYTLVANGQEVDTKKMILTR